MWSAVGDRSVTVDITFVRAFRVPPAITLGLTGLDSSHDQNLRFLLHATDIKAAGFKIEFLTWSDTHIARASVSWQAMGMVKSRSYKSIYTAVTPKPEISHEL